MRKKCLKKSVVLILLMFAAVWFAACVSGEPLPNHIDMQSVGIARVVGARVRSTLHVDFTVTNNGEEAFTFRRQDFNVRTTGFRTNNTTTGANRIIVDDAEIGELTVQPGETVAFSKTFNLSNNEYRFGETYTFIFRFGPTEISSHELTLRLPH